MSQILNGQLSQQNYYYDGQFQRPVQQLQQQLQQQDFNQQLQHHVQSNLQQQQTQNFSQQQQIYAHQQFQQINDQGIIVFDNSLPFQKMTNDGNNNNFLASSSSLINNDNNPNDRNLNLNVSSINYGNIHMSNNEDPLIAAISHHMLMIKDYRMKLDQHYFELEQNFKKLRSRDN
nr:14034_t:CDS:1 [Entrophospora candida]